MELSEWTKPYVKLVKAINKCDTEKIQALLKGGVDPTRTDSKTGQTALHVAVNGGNLEVLEVLLNSGQCNADTRDSAGRTALHCAVQNAKSDVTRRLLQTQPNALIVDSSHRSALHYASIGGQLGCVQHLLEYNAPVYLKDTDGRTPLFYAAERGQATICRLLLEKGADVNDSDNKNRTSLMIAAEKNHLAVCDYLIRQGANIHQVDIDDNDALSIAKKLHLSEIVKLLERAIIEEQQRRSLEHAANQGEDFYERIGDAERRSSAADVLAGKTAAESAAAAAGGGGDSSGSGGKVVVEVHVISATPTEVEPPSSVRHRISTFEMISESTAGANEEERHVTGKEEGDEEENVDGLDSVRGNEEAEETGTAPDDQTFNGFDASTEEQLTPVGVTSSQLAQTTDNVDWNQSRFTADVVPEIEQQPFSALDVDESEYARAVEFTAVDSETASQLPDQLSEDFGFRSYLEKAELEQFTPAEDTAESVENPDEMPSTWKEGAWRAERYRSATDEENDERMEVHDFASSAGKWRVQPLIVVEADDSNVEEGGMEEEYFQFADVDSGAVFSSTGIAPSGEELTRPRVDMVAGPIGTSGYTVRETLEQLQLEAAGQTSQTSDSQTTAFPEPTEVEADNGTRNRNPWSAEELERPTGEMTSASAVEGDGEMMNTTEKHAQLENLLAGETFEDHEKLIELVQAIEDDNTKLIQSLNEVKQHKLVLESTKTDLENRYSLLMSELQWLHGELTHILRIIRSSQDAISQSVVGSAGCETDSCSEHPQSGVMDVDSKLQEIQQLLLNLIGCRHDDGSRAADSAHGEAAVVSGDKDYGGLAQMVVGLRRENRDLHRRLEKVVEENRELELQVEGVEELIVIAEELKRENQGLIADCRSLKESIVQDQERDAVELAELTKSFREMVEENERLHDRNRQLLARMKDMERMIGEKRETEAAGKLDGRNAEELDEGKSAEQMERKSEEIMKATTSDAQLEVESRKLERNEERHRAELTRKIEENRILKVELEKMRNKLEMQPQVNEKDGKTEKSKLEKVPERSVNETGSQTHMSRETSPTSSDSAPAGATGGERKPEARRWSANMVAELMQTIKTKNVQLEELRVNVDRLYRQLETGNTALNESIQSARTDSVIEYRKLVEENARLRSAVRELTTGSSKVGRRQPLTSTPLAETTSRTDLLVGASPVMHVGYVAADVRQLHPHDGMDPEDIFNYGLGGGIAGRGRKGGGGGSTKLRQQTSDDSGFSRSRCMESADETTNVSEVDLLHGDEHQLIAQLTTAVVESRKIIEENRRLRIIVGDLKASGIGTSSMAAADPAESENTRLRVYAEQLESEVDALKRTVEEQSVYLFHSGRHEYEDYSVGNFRSEWESPYVSCDVTAGMEGDEDREDEEDGKHDEVSIGKDPETKSTLSSKDQPTAGSSEAGEEIVEEREDTTRIVGVLQRQNTILREELENTKQNWNEFESFVDETRSQLHQEIERLRGDQVGLHDELAAKDDLITELDAQLSMMSSELADSRRLLDDCEQAADQYWSTLVELDAQRRRLAGEGVEGEPDNDDRRSVDDFRRRLHCWTDDYETILAENRSLLAKNVELASENAHLSEHLLKGKTELEPKSVVSSDKSTDVDVQQSSVDVTIADLEKALLAAKIEQERKTKDYEETVRKISAERDEVGGRLNEVERRLKSRERDVEDLNDALENNSVLLASAMDENSRLRAEMKTKLDENAANLADVRKRYDAQLEKLRAENDALRQSAESRSPNMSLDYEEQLLTEIEQLTQERRSLQQQLAERQFELDEARDEMVEENEKLTRQTEELRRKLAAERSEILDEQETLVAENKRLREEVARLENQQRVSTEKARREFEEKLQQIEEEKMSVMTELQEKVMAENGQLHADLVKSCSERQQLRERCEKLESACVAFEELSNEMTGRCERLSVEISRLKSKGATTAASSAGGRASASTDGGGAAEVVENALAEARAENRRLIDETARLSMILEMEKLKSFTDAKSTNDAATDTLDLATDDDVGAVRRKRSTTSGTETEFAVGDEKVAELIRAKNELYAENKALRENAERSWTVSVQRGFKRSVASQTESLQIVPGGSLDDEVARLLSRTRTMRQNAAGFLFRLIDERERNVAAAAAVDVVAIRSAASSSRETSPSDAAAAEMPSLRTLATKYLGRTRRESSGEEDMRSWSSERIRNSDVNSSTSWKEQLLTRISEENSRLGDFIAAVEVLNDELRTMTSESAATGGLAGAAGGRDGASVSRDLESFPGAASYSSTSEGCLRDDEIDELVQLQQRVSQLQQQLQECERRRRDVICAYRRHLLSAVQGHIDPKIEEALKSIIMLKNHQETDSDEQ